MLKKRRTPGGYRNRIDKHDFFELAFADEVRSKYRGTSKVMAHDSRSLKLYFIKPKNRCLHSFDT